MNMEWEKKKCHWNIKKA